MKLVERMPVCKAVTKAKGDYFEESQIYFDLFTTLLVTCFHICFFIVLMSTLLFYNIENSTNNEKPLNELDLNF